MHTSLKEVQSPVAFKWSPPLSRGSCENTYLESLVLLSILKWQHCTFRCLEDLNILSVQNLVSQEGRGACRVASSAWSTFPLLPKSTEQDKGGESMGAITRWRLLWVSDTGLHGQECKCLTVVSSFLQLCRNGISTSPCFLAYLLSLIGTIP